MIKGCIFDLDGVIVDTAKYHFVAWRRLAGEMGFEFTETHNERLKGVSRQASLEILLEVGKVEGLTPQDKERLMKKKNDWYLEYIGKMTPEELLEGVVDFVKELKTSGVLIALGSASKNAVMILNKVGILSLFDAVIDGNSISAAKPDPEVFLLGSAALGVAPEHCVVFEDAEAGIEAAHRAGMRCVGVGKADILHDADAIISGFNEFTIEKFKKLLYE